MGTQISKMKKINYTDMQSALEKKYTIINVIDKSKQTILIKNTIMSDIEEEQINKILDEKRLQSYIIIYGMNCNDEGVIEKYKQLVSLGFINVYVYMGGLFEWLCLQELYGVENFPTTKITSDILSYAPPKQLGIMYISE
jgi:hypothetical protein